MTQRGFTLLELLISLCILSILLLIGLPSFTQIIEKTQMELVGDDFFSAIQLTRNTAVGKNQRVTMRNFGSWDLGWEIFIDTDHDGIRDDNDSLIMSGSRVEKVQILSNSPVKDYISFIGTGESRKTGSPQGALQMGSLYVCTLDGSQGLALILFHSGRLRVEEADQNQCS
ncbi:GspH/FimT family pseudopilin [Microbulbifer sp. JTAC008]|uniref:GspH/FimT family pseudopilin n=1 Tax=unclassified Microbulbifer TaxID=2619833 RepID=UPI00403A5587